MCICIDKSKVKEEIKVEEITSDPDILIKYEGVDEENSKWSENNEGDSTSRYPSGINPEISDRTQESRHRTDNDYRDSKPPAVCKPGCSSCSAHTESDDSVETAAKRQKELGPASSDSSESSKYYEFRDKNNYASRRSRQKRKIQELTIMQEKDELESKNIRLKVQVEELEKAVANFRKDLTNILLKK